MCRASNCSAPAGAVPARVGGRLARRGDEGGHLADDLHRDGHARTAASARPRADYDTNGWPQTPRNRAVREMRKAFAVPHRRRPAPAGRRSLRHRRPSRRPGRLRRPGGQRRLSALVGAEQPAKGPRPKSDTDLHRRLPRQLRPSADRARRGERRRPAAPGTCRRSCTTRPPASASSASTRRTARVTVECWPFLADVTQAGTQFPGWPVTINLPTIHGQA